MKKILFIIASIVFTIQLNASHQVAGDIGYTCLGNNTYEFYIYFYRDCGGIAAPTSLYLNGTSSCGTLPITLNPFDLSPNDPSTFGIVDPIGYNPIYQSTCNGGIYPGYEIYKFVGTATVAQCSDWSFCADDCCRNASPSFPPLVPSATYIGTSMAYSCTMNNADGTCDNSPEWNQSPVKYICQGIFTQIDNGAVDPDGDSLTFELIDPLEGCGSGTVSFNTPFSATYPMTTNSGVFSFDPITGMSTLTPTFQTGVNEVAVMAIKISSYRAGVLKGSIMRDMQVVTMQGCMPLSVQNQGPSALGSETTIEDNVITVYAGDELDFSVMMVNIELNTFIFSNTLKNIFPSTQFTTSAPQFDYVIEGRTVLLTDDSHVGTYNFNLVATNTGGPVLLSESYPYILNVLERSLNPTNSINSLLVNGFKVYPNPATDEIGIELPEGLDKGQVSILDITGKEYLSKSLVNNTTTLGLDIPKGIYFVKIKSSEGSVVKKLIVE